MNGQMYQIAKIVVAAKKAMQTNAQKYELVMGENSVQFQFLPEKWLFGTRSHTAKTVAEWFERVQEEWLAGYQVVCPLESGKQTPFGFFKHDSECDPVLL